MRAPSGSRRQKGDQATLQRPAGDGRGQRRDRHHLSLEAEAEKEEAEGGVRSDLRRIPTHAQIFPPVFLRPPSLFVSKQ